MEIDFIFVYFRHIKDEECLQECYLKEYSYGIIFYIYYREQ